MLHECCVAGWIETVARIVKQQDAGLLDQRARDRETAQPPCDSERVSVPLIRVANPSGRAGMRQRHADRCQRSDDVRIGSAGTGEPEVGGTLP